jgi:hypothetical protein
MSKEIPSFDQPIMLVAGGCDERHEKKILQYQGLFERAFARFAGTIISGCTNVGVNKLVGDLADEANKIQKIAYYPQTSPSWIEKHAAFKKIYTDGHGFSALDPIQTWLDILASDVNPCDVKLFGLGGGEIAGFEYRMAAAFGAKVGLLTESGRAAGNIFQDENWRDAEGIIRLPNDEETIKLFISGYESSEALKVNREALARMIHADYRQDQLRSKAKKEPNLKDWEDLPLDLQESNRQQADHIEEKLRAVGLKIRRADPDEITLYDFEEHKEQVEELARLEHARWNVERLLGGWRLGDKDIDKKTSPYLLPWSDLPKDVKKWDYEFVETIPKKLKKVGYEIVEPEDKRKGTESKKSGNRRS